MSVTILVTIGAMLLCSLSGIVGAFSILKKESLMGDVIGHSSLFYILLVYMLFKTKNMNMIILGVSAGSLLLILFITKLNYKKVKKDSLMAVLMSMQFGIGLCLMTYLSSRGNSFAGIMSYIFGYASTMLKSEIYNMIIILIVISIFLILFFRQFEISIFDKEYAISIGIKEKIFNALLSTFLVITAVVGLQIVGATLISAVLILPFSIARKYSNKLSKILILSAIIGAIAGGLGALISSYVPNMPTGPTITVILVLMFLKKEA